MDPENIKSKATAMESILNEFRDRIAKYDSIVKRLYVIEEKLQGGRPEEPACEKDSPDKNYVSEFQYISDQLRWIFNEMDSTITNIESIV